MAPRRRMPRRDRIRSSSVPAPYRYSARKTAASGLFYRISKFRLGADTFLTRHRIHVAAGLTVLTCAYVVRNLRAWATQEPSPLVTQ